ncbi:LpqB family beta-propeller domain-containing protein [Arthrobacter sp. Br18]|uniref:LpqB family beta-propeller domain-containing protein n=1 Tax=Arthrobacter sp. Br18 TaxID=1312954 RepID=UPI00047C58F3|nr:LpqB family beta-propeller domain-containing protein [Arthrobacter sp. Br18]
MKFRSRSATRGAPAMMLAVLLTIAGCSSIPTSGPVTTITAAAENDSVSAQAFSPEGPSEGAAPERILQDFITAGTGAGDGYSVARQYLTSELAASWQPEGRIVVFRADPRIVQREGEEGGPYLIQLETTGTIDDQGVRTNTLLPSSESISAEMVQVNGQWRISGIPDGIMITESNARALMISHTLYFYSGNYLYWVPDVRWFVRRTGVSARIVQAMLAGPAPYLQGSVTSAFPEGVTLARESVPIRSGVASVELSEEVLQDATELGLEQMQQQLQINLTRLNDVTSVEMTAGQPIPLDEPEPDLVTPVRDPSVGNEQVAVSHNELVTLRNGAAVAIENFPSVASYSPKDPATSISGGSYAFLSGDGGRLLATAPGSEVRTVAEGTALTAPSFDPGNWVWTARAAPGAAAGQGSEVVAVPPGGTSANAVVVPAPWLADRVVRELRVSRDGARALVVAERAGATEVFLAGITRSAQSVPESLNTPLTLSIEGDIDTAKWAGDTTIVASGSSAEATSTPVIYELNGSSTLMNPLTGVVNISAGSNVEDAFYAQIGDSLVRRLGSAWTEDAKGVQDPAFPG